MDFDFLALGIVPRIECDGHFKNSVFAFEYFCSELRLKIETIGADDHSFNDFAFKYFVARFHIGQNGIVQDIGHQGQGFVGDHVPEHRYAMGAPEKARAVDNIRKAFLNGF